MRILHILYFIVLILIPHTIDGVVLESVNLSDINFRGARLRYRSFADSRGPPLHLEWEILSNENNRTQCRGSMLSVDSSTLTQELLISCKFSFESQSLVVVLKDPETEASVTTTLPVNLPEGNVPFSRVSILDSSENFITTPAARPWTNEVRNEDRVLISPRGESVRATATFKPSSLPEDIILYDVYVYLTSSSDFSDALSISVVNEEDITLTTRTVDASRTEGIVYLGRHRLSRGSRVVMDNQRTLSKPFAANAVEFVREGHLPCPEYSESVLSESSGLHTCVCAEGFQNDITWDSRDGTWAGHCEDVNECADSSNECVQDENAVCTNTLGSYECACLQGFTSSSSSYCTSTPLMYTVSPQSTANINATDRWLDVDDMILNVNISDISTTMVLTYSIVVRAEIPRNENDGDLMLHSNTERGHGDFLGTRLVVDNLPYRQSGSHLSPLRLDDRTSTHHGVSELVGRLVIQDVTPGLHEIRVQWKKWGQYVRSWTSDPHIVAPGYSTSRNIFASVHHRDVQFAQPTSLARLYRSEVWEDVSGMSLSLDVDDDVSTSFWRLDYALHVRPSSVPTSSSSTNNQIHDFVETRIVIDGVSYRESRSSFRVNVANFKEATLLGSVSLSLGRDEVHHVKVQWRKWGSTVRMWLSQPSFLDGFVEGRSLSATELWFPTFLETSSSITTNSSSLPSAWHTLANSAVSFDLYAVRSQIALSYAVNFHGQSNDGSSTVDMWTWTRWGRLLMTRMVLRSNLVDEEDLEVTFVLPGAPVSPAHQVSDSYGPTHLLNSLKPGEYNVELQWRLMDPNMFRGNVSRWSLFRERMSVFGGSRVFLRSVNSWNQAPTIESEHRIFGLEDVSMSFQDSLSLIDFDSNDSEDVEITFYVRHGVMMYTDGVGYSGSSRNLTRVGHADEIVSSVQYMPDSNWYVLLFVLFEFRIFSALTHSITTLKTHSITTLKAHSIITLKTQVRTRCYDNHHERSRS